MRFQFFTTLFGNTKKADSSGEVIPETSYLGINEATIQSGLSTTDRNRVDPSDSSLSTNDKVSFTIEREMNGSRFELDSANQISRVTWIGNVDLATAKELVTLGADSVEFQGYDRLILDRSELAEFDPEATLWVKCFLKARARRIVGSVSKLAVINAISIKGSVFSNFIAPVISIALPSLNMQRFDNAGDSIPWLLSE